MRDYYIFYAKDKNSKLFHRYGALSNNIKEWQVDEVLIHRWKNGHTGIPLIDACMRELKFTGWLSNRGRQVVASFFALDLG